jgi:hypothetical protein
MTAPFFISTHKGYQFQFLYILTNIYLLPPFPLSLFVPPFFVPFLPSLLSFPPRNSASLNGYDTLVSLEKCELAT